MISRSPRFSGLETGSSVGGNRQGHHGLGPSESIIVLLGLCIRSLHAGGGELGVGSIGMDVGGRRQHESFEVVTSLQLVQRGAE